MKTIYAIFFILITFQLIGCGGAEERKAVYMEKAEKSLAAGDYDKARIELQNVIQIDPKDAQAFYKLGQIFEAKKEYRKAFEYYNSAAELAPDVAEYQAKMGHIYLNFGGGTDKSREKLVLIQNIDKDNVYGLLLEAAILLREDKSEEAKSIAKKLYETHPDQVENVIFITSIYAREGDYAKAAQILEKAVQQKPDDILLLNVLANIQFANKNYARAEEVYKKIQAAYPEVFENHLKLALFYKIQNRLSDAENVLRNAIKLNEDDVNRKFALIKLIQERDGNKAAVVAAKTVVDDNPSIGNLRLMLGSLQIASNDMDGAAETYQKTIEKFNDGEVGIKARIALATIYLQKNNIEGAEKVIDAAHKISPNDPDVNFVEAKIAVTKKDYEKAVIALRSVVKDKPEEIDAYFLLSAAHNAINESNQAADVMVRAYENNRTNPKALLSLARYYIANKKIPEAEKAIDDHLRLDENDYDAISIKAAILNSRQQTKDAHALAEKMRTLYPDKSQGYIQSIPYLMPEKSADAVKLLKLGIEKTGDVQLHNILAEVQIASKMPDEAIKDLTTALKSTDNESLYLLLAKAHLSKGEVDPAITALTNSIAHDSSRVQSYVTLAKIYLGKKNNAKAISILKSGIAENNDAIRLTFLLAEVYENNGDFDSAISQYDNILKVSADNVLAINNLAVILAEHKQDQLSLDRAKSLADKLKDVDQPVIKDTVGWVYYKTGDYSGAVSTLKQVVAVNPEVPIFNYHLGMSYHGSGDKVNAKLYLEKALSSGAGFQGSERAKEVLGSL